MAEWGWVVAGFVLTYGTLAAYAASLSNRLRRTERGGR